MVKYCVSPHSLGSDVLWQICRRRREEVQPPTFFVWCYTISTLSQILKCPFFRWKSRPPKSTNIFLYKIAFKIINLYNSCSFTKLWAYCEIYICKRLTKCNQAGLPNKVKMQYVHFRLHSNCCLLPWKIPEEFSRRSISLLRAASTSGSNNLTLSHGPSRSDACLTTGGRW